jgi:hypothetical protein
LVAGVSDNGSLVRIILSTGAIVFGNEDEAICPVGDVDRVKDNVLKNSFRNHVGKVNNATTDAAPAIAPPNAGKDGDPPTVGCADGISVQRRL